MQYYQNQNNANESNAIKEDVLVNLLKQNNDNQDSNNNQNQDQLEEEVDNNISNMQVDGVDNDEIEGDTTLKGLLFEMEFNIDEDNNHHTATSINFAGELLQKWIKSEVIGGALANDESIMIDRFNDIQAWALPLKII